MAGAGSRRTTPKPGKGDGEQNDAAASGRAHVANVNSVGNSRKAGGRRTAGVDASKSLPPKPTRTAGSY